MHTHTHTHARGKDTPAVLVPAAVRLDSHCCTKPGSSVDGCPSACSQKGQLSQGRKLAIAGPQLPQAVQAAKYIRQPSALSPSRRRLPWPPDPQHHHVIVRLHHLAILLPQDLHTSTHTHHRHSRRRQLTSSTQTAALCPVPCARCPLQTSPQSLSPSLASSDLQPQNTQVVNWYKLKSPLQPLSTSNNNNWTLLPVFDMPSHRPSQLPPCPGPPPSRPLPPLPKRR